ncbi:MAG: class IV adenylate cyclase [Melioribacter sp.]|nr:class IV adenylate cyclase [Melioribacter sp.]
MATNLELKIKIESLKSLEKKLKSNNIKFIKLLKQKDIYYKYHKGLLKLRVEQNNYYLIKYKRSETGIRWSNYEIIELKGKNIEKYLSDILEVECIVEKERKLYMHKNTRVHLDKVKNLGNFLELETLVLENKRKAKKEFNEIINFLELDLSKQINKSYKDLLV